MEFSRRSVFVFAFGLIGGLVFAPFVKADINELLIVHNRDWPPFEFADKGIANGINPTILDMVFQNLGKYKLRHMALPWKRAQERVANDQADGLLAFPSDQRKTYLSFSDTIVTYATPGIFFSANHPKRKQLEKLSSLHELKDFRVGDLIGNGWAEQVIAKHTDMEWLSTFEQIFKMLLSNRIDVHVASSLEMTQWNIEKFKINDDSLVSRSIPEIAKPIPLHSGLRKTMPGHKEILALFDREFAKIRHKVPSILNQFKKPLE
jgi:ABC-type amino acid transport substrate-binding protein